MESHESMLAANSYRKYYSTDTYSLRVTSKFLYVGTKIVNYEVRRILV